MPYIMSVLVIDLAHRVPDILPCIVDVPYQLQLSKLLCSVEVSDSIAEPLCVPHQSSSSSLHPNLLYSDIWVVSVNKETMTLTYWESFWRGKRGPTFVVSNCQFSSWVVKILEILNSSHLFSLSSSGKKTQCHSDLQLLFKFFLCQFCKLNSS